MKKSGTAKVHMRNTSDGPRVYTDVHAGSVEFGPGEARKVTVSKAGAEALRGGGAWELVKGRGAAKKGAAKKGAKGRAAKSKASGHVRMPLTPRNVADTRPASVKGPAVRLPAPGRKAKTAAPRKTARKGAAKKGR